MLWRGLEKSRVGEVGAYAVVAADVAADVAACMRCIVVVRS